MGTSPIELIERIRGKSLSSEEKDMFIRMKDNLRCSDDDALWQMLAVLEYQKDFYMTLPERITAQTDKLLAGISEAAEKEVARAQGKLVECVVAEARNLNLKSKTSVLIILGMAAMILFFLISSLMMWAGFRLGTGGTELPKFMFKMPSGLMIGLLFFGAGGIFSYWTTKAYTDEKKTWWHQLLCAVSATGLGAWLLVISL